jgi:hypothetical protein
MNVILNVRTVAAIFLLGCCSLLAAAQDPPEASAPAASTATQEVPPADAAGKKSFRLKIDADGGESSAPKGIQISLGDDEDHAAVVTTVIGRLETALEGLPDEVRNSEQGDIAELRAAMEDLRAMKDSPEVHREIRVHEEDDSFLEQLVPVVALLVIFGGPVLIVAIVSRNNRRKREMVHQTIDRIIAQGKDVPVELLDALDKGSNGKSGLARGTVNVALGLGIGGMFLANAGVGAASIGLIPLAIGLAQLLVWKLEAPRKQQAG